MTGVMEAAGVDSPPELGRARGSSFYVAMRILPKPRRLAMYAIYDFCREVDDIADEGGPREARLAELARWRQAIEELYAGGKPARAAFLEPHVTAFGLEKSDFLDMIAGMEMDAAADIRAPSLATLDLYCDRVASSVGRLSTAIFGLDRDTGRDLAHHLGRGLQLTNILRDIDEDAGIGRLYLPREFLTSAGIATTEPQAALADDAALDRVCRDVAQLAARHLAQADTIMRRCPRAAVKAPRLMYCAYSPLLARMMQRGWTAPRERVGVDKLGLVGAVIRYGIL